MSILSKGEFRQLALLRHRSEDPTDVRNSQIYAVVNAYDRAIDALSDAQAEREGMRRDISKLVHCLPVSYRIPRLRLALVGLLLPWTAKVFGCIKNLCKYVE